MARVHWQEPNEEYYAQAACGAPLTTGPTTTDADAVDCAACRALTEKGTDLG